MKPLDKTQIIIRPLLTEKSTRQAHARNTYSFVVHNKATKPEIRAAVESLYNVKVVDVRTIVRKGKMRRTKTGYTNTGDWKRALVALDKDSKIELF